MKQAYISFIVPVYNTPLEDLRRCVESILQIEKFPIELIVVDDGSREEKNTEYNRLFEMFSDNRVKFLRQKNGGVSSARNTGMNAASGKYVMFVDSDDIILPDALSNDYHADFVMFSHVFVKGKEKIVRTLIEGDSRDVAYSELAWAVLQSRLRGACGLLYNRKLLADGNICFERGCVHGEDADFNFLFMIKEPTIQYVNKPVYLYYFNSRTVTGRWKKAGENILKSEVKRFARFMDYLEEKFFDHPDMKKEKLVVRQINILYRNVIELSSAKKITESEKKIVYDYIIGLKMPENVDKNTKKQYNIIVNKKWWIVEILGKIRCCYLWLMKI